MTVNRNPMDRPSIASRRRRRTGAASGLLPVSMLMAILAGSPAAAQVSGYKVAMPPSPKAGELTAFQPCSFKAPPSRGVDTAQCATFCRRRELPRKPAGRLIALPVVKLHGVEGRTPGRHLLAARRRPGGSNFDFEVDARGVFDAHDIYMLGYRGVDDPTPLQCPEIMKAMVLPHPLGAKTGALITAASRRCAARFEARGIDLRHYTMVDVIQDHEGLRTALGLPKVNLMGESYRDAPSAGTTPACAPPT